MTKNVTDLMIREAAYYLWEKAGKPNCSGEEFWIQACAQFYEVKDCKKKAPAKKNVSCKTKKVTAKKK